MTATGGSSVDDRRQDTVASAAALFDSGAYEARLREWVAIRSTSQDEAHAADVRHYLDGAVVPWLEAMGFSCEVHANPVPGFGPILRAWRIEDPGLPTVITYGHGDTVRGMKELWSPGLDPWVLTRIGERWYGRGTADNKGQHLCNLLALEHVLAIRGGTLGYNVKLVLEMSEERGSAGLAEFVERQAGLLSGDVFIASDGPRVAPHVPTVSGGTRGNFQFDLAVHARKGGVHSGHWGGLTRDPAILLAHALGTICDASGRILVKEWLPGGGAPLDPAVRATLAGCALDDGGDAAEVEAGWGEPGLSAAERRYAWTSFIVRAMTAGLPDTPQNAVAPFARAACEIRYTPELDPATFLPALRAHLDARRLQAVAIEDGRVRMPAGSTPAGSPWLPWAAASIGRSTGKAVQVIPNISGGMPGQAFAEHLGVPLVWVPHGHNGCKQHGPDEHMLVGVAREAVMSFSGLWYDLAEPGSPFIAAGGPA